MQESPSTHVGELWPESDALLPGFVWEEGSMSKLEISTEILQALQRVSGLLESDSPVDATLQTVADLCVSTIPGCDSAGVTVRVDGHHATAAASDAYAFEIDKIQYDANEGPCVFALEEATFIQIDAVSEETRWPEFCERAAQHGFRSSLSYPLVTDENRAALNIYGKAERVFDEAGIGIGELLASQATVALKNARMLSASRHLADQLQVALENRDTIGQAKGILMERERITDAQAFEMLKTISQSTNVKLRDVAQRLIEDAVRNTPG